MWSRRTSYRMWAAFTLAIWGGYLVWDYFAEPLGVMWLALDILRDGRPIVFLHPVGLNGCVFPCARASLVAAIAGWAVQAIIGRLGFRGDRKPDAALVADFDDKPGTG